MVGVGSALAQHTLMCHDDIHPTRLRPGRHCGVDLCAGGPLEDRRHQAITDAATTAVEQLGDTTGGLAEVAVQAIDPNVPAALNQWTYTAGQVPDPPPVDYDDDTEALQQNLFALSEVPATAIVAAVDNAIGASGIADGDVQSVVIKQVRTDKTGLVIDVR